MSGKRNHSPELQGPAKRRNQDSGPPTVSQLAAAEELFLRARSNQMYQPLLTLIDSHTTSQKREAFYTSIFKEFAQIIANRDDIPVPPGDHHDRDFLDLFDPDCEKMLKEKQRADRAMQSLIRYIRTEVAKLTAEDKKHPPQTNTPESYVSVAVRKAWETGYVGDNHGLLQRAMNDMYFNSHKRRYGNFCAIIQGSGTGKSRLVHELSRSVFAIPIILRPEGDNSGFPCGDRANGRPLVEFFCGFKSESALQVQRYYLLFLLRAMTLANEWIDGKIAAGCRPELLAAEWQNHLGPPQSETRIAMYSRALDMSPSLEGFEDILEEKDDAVTQKKVEKFIGRISQKIKPSGTTKEPAILFYFDEAHHLTKTTVTGQPKRTAYQCLCKAFTYMMKTPVFVLFLSTYSRLSEFAPSARYFWSARPQTFQSTEGDDNLNAPFVELPFDTWKNPILVTEGSHSADEILSLRFMARFGRPLFWALLEHSESTDENDAMAYAMSKLELRLEDSTRDKPDDHLLNALIPPLAARIDLTFESNRDEAVFLEGLLVASSLRTVYSVPQHRQYLRGGYPSEPFLGEAAARVIYRNCRIKGPIEQLENIDDIIENYKARIPSAVLAWFKQGLIDKGNRGELVARMLCTLAHDISILKNPSFVGNASLYDGPSFSQMIPVIEFLRALVSEQYIEAVLKARPSNLSGETLEEAFKDGFVHFTQFVKAGDKSTITDEGIYLLFVRGAAIQGYGNMDKADLVIPVWLRCKGDPDRWCMTAIFIQVKNRVDKQFILIDAQKIFGFFTTSSIKEHSQRPYITIAMELGVLLPEQKAASQPKSKSRSKGSKSKSEASQSKVQEPKATQSKEPKGSRSKKKESESRSKQAKASQSEVEPPLPTTPEHKSIPLVAQTPNRVWNISRVHGQELRSKGSETHPRYEIFITGCSNRVYNVVGDVSYSGLLAHKDMLAEHPRKGEYVDAIKKMKPYWVADSSYDWAEVKVGSRLGAHIIEPEDVYGSNAQGLDFGDRNRSEDSEDQPDGVFVNEYHEDDMDVDTADTTQ